MEPLTHIIMQMNKQNGSVQWFLTERWMKGWKQRNYVKLDSLSSDLQRYLDISSLDTCSIAKFMAKCKQQCTQYTLRNAYQTHLKVNGKQQISKGSTTYVARAPDDIIGFSRRNIMRSWCSYLCMCISLATKCTVHSTFCHNVPPSAVSQLAIVVSSL